MPHSPCGRKGMLMVSESGKMLLLVLLRWLPTQMAWVYPGTHGCGSSVQELVASSSSLVAYTDDLGVPRHPRTWVICAGAGGFFFFFGCPHRSWVYPWTHEVYPMGHLCGCCRHLLLLLLLGCPHRWPGVPGTHGVGHLCGCFLHR